MTDTPESATRATAATRMPNYPEPTTPSDTHPTGCIGCKLDNGPHAWTPPTATPVAHREVSREQIPGEGPCGHTAERVVCACGRAVRSIFPWFIREWMTDHDATLTKWGV